MCTRVCVCFALLVSVPAQRRSTLFSGLLSSILQKKKILVQIYGSRAFKIQGRVTPSRRCGKRWLSQRRALHSAQEGDRAHPQLISKARPQGAELLHAMAALSIRGRGVGCTGVAGATFSPVASSVRCLATPGPERAVLTGTLFFCFHITTSVLHLVRLYRFAGALLYWAWRQRPRHSGDSEYLCLRFVCKDRTNF